MLKTDLRSFLLFVILLFCVSCRDNIPGLVIDDAKQLDSIPSGSGLVIRNDSAYIIGDDATGLYQLNLDDLKFRKIPLPGFSLTEYRKAKDNKHDFESLAILDLGNDYLAAFGSGSKRWTRDSILLVNTDNLNDTKILSVHGFYKALQAVTQTDSLQWNIEGATVAGDHMYLCNRGNNMLIQFQLKDLALFQPGSPLPEIKTYRVKLPAIENRVARLSGICTIDENHLLLTASVEDTDNWINDGPVMGSYLAVYSLRSNKIISSFLLEDAAGKPLIEKLESVDIREKKPGGELKLIAIADNDNGSTRIFRLTLQFNQE
jgi:hypothetical protein